MSDANPGRREALKSPRPLAEPCLALRRSDLVAAQRAGIVDPAQAEALWRWGEEGGRVLRPADSAVAPGTGPRAPRFTVVNVLYYFGGMVVIGALWLFMRHAWDWWGAWGFAALAGAWLAGAVTLARQLQRRGLSIAAGVMGALAVCLVALLAWGVQHALGLWPESASEAHYAGYFVPLDWRWIFVEAATLVGGAALLWWLRLPFMVMPLAVTAWYLCLSLGRLLLPGQDFDWELARDISLGFGVALLLLAFWVDFRTRRARTVPPPDCAFWLYLVGAIAGWGGLTLMYSDSEWANLAYGLANAGFIVLGAIIGRRVFTVLGAFGVAGYLGHLAWDLFRDSALFPLVLALLGLALIVLAVWWQRHEPRIRARLAGLVQRT